MLVDLGEVANSGHCPLANLIVTFNIILACTLHKYLTKSCLHRRVINVRGASVLVITSKNSQEYLKSTKLVKLNGPQ